MAVKDVTDISYNHRRIRQDSVVSLLDALRDKASTGELVGLLTIYVDKDGVWHHARDLFNSDSPALFGYIDIVKHGLVEDYLG